MSDRKSSRPRMPEAEWLAVLNLRNRAMQYTRTADSLNVHVVSLDGIGIDTMRPVDVAKFRELHKRLGETARALEQAALAYSVARKGSK